MDGNPLNKNKLKDFLKEHALIPAIIGAIALVLYFGILVILFPPNTYHRKYIGSNDFLYGDLDPSIKLGLHASIHDPNDAIMYWMELKDKGTGEVRINENTPFDSFNEVQEKHPESFFYMEGRGSDSDIVLNMQEPLEQQDPALAERLRSLLLKNTSESISAEALRENPEGNNEPEMREYDLQNYIIYLPLSAVDKVAFSGRVANHIGTSYSSPLLYIVFAVGAVAILLEDRLFPMRKKSKPFFKNKYFSLPLEIKYLLPLIIIWFCLFQAKFNIIGNVIFPKVTGEKTDFIPMVVDRVWIFGAFFLSYMLIHSVSLSVARDLQLPDKKVLLRESLLYKGTVWGIKTVKKTASWIADLDWSNMGQRRALLTFGIQIGILFIFYINFYLNIVYIVALLLYFIVRLYRNMELAKKIDYMEEKTKKLSEGDFSVQLDESMHPFSNIAHNINNMGEGLSKAVESGIKSERMKTELISNVSHDLKTPLTSIINYSDLIQQEDLDAEEKKDYARIIHDKSKRLKVLIEDLFEVSKTSSGEVELYKENINIMELLRQSIGEQEEELARKGISVVLYSEKEEYICYLDGQKTYRVFENLLMNIQKYSMNNTRVYIDVESRGKRVRITFKNIASYEMNFKGNDMKERFSRGDISRTTEGSGLGLAIANNIVELQGGFLDIIVDGDLFKAVVSFPLLETDSENKTPN